MKHQAITLRLALGLAVTVVACADYGSDGSSAVGGTASTTGGNSSSGGNAASTGGQQSTGGAATGGSGPATGGSSSTGGGGGACSNVSPCGGDVVGTWTVMSSCLTVSGELDLSIIGIDCTRGQITGGGLQVSGQFAFKADKSYLDETTTTGDVQFTLADQCLNWSGTRTTCDGVGRSGIPSIGFDNTSGCQNAASGSGCTCRGHVNQSGWMGVVSINATTSDVYTTSGNVIMLLNGAVESPYEYCVSGNTLTLTPKTTYPTTTGAIVLQKQ